MSETIFAKIVKGDIPCYKVYENEHVLAFLDITQVTKGHTLLIPKTSVADVFEWDETIAIEMGKAIPLIAHALQKAFPTMKGLNLINNNREAAYQTVFHSHIHFIPRYNDQDDFGLVMHSNMADYTPEEMNAIAQTIANQINA